MHVQSCCFANLSLLLFFAVLDDVTVVVKTSLLRTRKYNFCFGIRWIYWFERLSCVNSFWVIKGRRQVTYQLLDSVEEDKVYHGIKIEWFWTLLCLRALQSVRPGEICKILLLRSLFGHRAWLWGKKGWLLAVYHSPFYESPVWKSVSKAVIHNLAPSCQVIITLFEKK